MAVDFGLDHVMKFSNRNANKEYRMGLVYILQENSVYLVEEP